jgi:hypothetical protein
MKTLQIEEKKARELYKTASEELKKILEDTFGKDFLSEKVTDRVKTYEDACRELNEDPINESEMRRMGFTNDEISYRKIKTIVEALNEGWKADWENGDQKKWIPWFYCSPSGFVFDFTSCLYSRPYASYASHLCFKSEELATYAGKQFVELYRNFIM